MRAEDFVIGSGQGISRGIADVANLKAIQSSNLADEVTRRKLAEDDRKQKIAGDIAKVYSDYQTELSAATAAPPQAQERIPEGLTAEQYAAINENERLNNGEVSPETPSLPLSSAANELVKQRAAQDLNQRRTEAYGNLLNKSMDVYLKHGDVASYQALENHAIDSFSKLAAHSPEIALRMYNSGPLAQKYGKLERLGGTNEWDTHLNNRAIVLTNKKTGEVKIQPFANPAAKTQAEYIIQQGQAAGASFAQINDALTQAELDKKGPMVVPEGGILVDPSNNRGIFKNPKTKAAGEGDTGKYNTPAAIDAYYEKLKKMIVDETGHPIQGYENLANNFPAYYALDRAAIAAGQKPQNIENLEKYFLKKAKPAATAQPAAGSPSTASGGATAPKQKTFKISGMAGDYVDLLKDSVTGKEYGVRVDGVRVEAPPVRSASNTPNVPAAPVRLSYRILPGDMIEESFPDSRPPANAYEKAYGVPPRKAVRKMTPYEAYTMAAAGVNR